MFFTILLVAGNTMAQAVRERIEEIGLLKAIGFTNRGVRRLVLIESCIIALLGGGLGLAIGWWLVSQGDPTGGAFPIFYFPTRDLLIGVVLALALGVVAGIFPAMRAQRLQVAEALRR